MMTSNHCVVVLLDSVFGGSLSDSVSRPGSYFLFAPEGAPCLSG